VQITVVGDFEPEQLEKHFKDFLGTVAPRSTPLALPHVPITFTRDLPIPQRHLVRFFHFCLC
jgi:predicted Zn-dependent peptidase